MKKFLAVLALAAASLAFSACSAAPPIGVVVAVYAPSPSDEKGHYVVELQRTGNAYPPPNDLLTCAVADECKNLGKGLRVLFAKDESDSSLYHFQAALEPKQNR